jgi:hypothetical protein
MSVPLLAHTVSLAALGLLFLGSARSAEWTVGLVEPGAGGRFSSLRIDKYDNAHVSYFDESQSLIVYSFWDHSLNKWFTTSVDRGSGFCSLALDSKQHPHISYPEGSEKVTEAYWDGSAWQKRPVVTQAKIINYYTSIALDAQDNPMISFYEEIGAGYNQGRLRTVAWNGKYWELRTVDGDIGSGKFNSIAMDSMGHPQIAYGNVEYKNASLRYARWNGRSWEIEVLEGAGKPGTSMWSVAMVLDKADQPHIAYTDVANRLVKYATKKGGRWDLQAVDSLSRVSYPDRNGIALDDKGDPYISYYDAAQGLLKVAHQENQRWVTEVVDRSFAGLNSSLQIAHGRIWITYADESGERLKFALRLPAYSLNQETRGSISK